MSSTNSTRGPYEALSNAGRLGRVVTATTVASEPAEAVERGKPAPSVYEHAAALGVDPGGCVALEYWVHGAMAAVETGMACVGYRPDGGDLPEVERTVAGSVGR